MKNFRVYILLVILMVSLTACLGGNVYKSEKNNFSMNYPNGWEKQGKVMGTEVTFLAPKQNSQDKMQESISVFVEKNSKSLDDYFKQVVEQSKKMLEENYKNEMTEKVTISGIDGYKLVYDQADNNIRRATYVFKHEDKFFVITYSALANDFDVYSKEVQATLDSFKFGKAEEAAKPTEGTTKKYTDIDYGKNK